MTFRVYCVHCRVVVLTGVTLLGDDDARLLADHLRTYHPTFVRRRDIALGDLLRHFEFRTDSDVDV